MLILLKVKQEIELAFSVLCAYVNIRVRVCAVGVHVYVSVQVPAYKSFGHVCVIACRFEVQLLRILLVVFLIG